MLLVVTCESLFPGFKATPCNHGQQFLFVLYLWWAWPAFRMGLSSHHTNHSPVGLGDGLPRA